MELVAPHFPGIPWNSEPVMEAEYNADLLSGEATIQATSTTAKLIDDTRLFINFPHGLHVLQTVAPELLRQCRSVHISGTWGSEPPAPPRWLRARQGYKRETRRETQGEEARTALRQLSQLVAKMFVPDAPYPVEKLELRIYYPGDSYRAIWREDDSPISAAMNNLCCAGIHVKVSRGRMGNGVHLVALPAVEGVRQVNSIAWDKLDESGRNPPGPGGFMVDPSWPGSI
ncbi:uncharacterized protein RCC_04951 [Ramularia collo-cygni]|uniref:Uncharacterized protein n=1 Tax=Ramularia collo-cygni TaxID=112498 RepID=A0A2D3UXN9_9PEZI|nr:uncharacterized protein RCC_04951 [Ramularia collo-cygni]CZT19105.1 uncharacterized protein RCC_04951 [Ramularia collo-cygni]